MKHKFDKGQRVSVTGRAGSQGLSSADRFTVIQQMPADREGFLYRVKGDKEPHDRVVQEAALVLANW